MTKTKLFLPLLAAVTLAGCVTTEQMPDGTTKIRFSDEAVGSLASMMPKQLVTGIAGGAGGIGGLDLIPTRSPLQTGQFMYFNGQYEFECAAALLYSAKSGRPMDADTSGKCRDSYFLRQSQLKMAGKPYDRGAPEFDPSNPPNAYWAQVSGRTISQLAAMEQFKTRFEGLPRIDGSGNISINVRFLGVGLGQPVALATTPARTPVTMDDATFAFGMRNRAAQDKTEVGQSIVCDGVLAYSKALDKGRRPANIPTSEYSRYEVRFTVASLGCQDGTRRFQAASR